MNEEEARLLGAGFFEGAGSLASVSNSSHLPIVPKQPHPSDPSVVLQSLSCVRVCDPMDCNMPGFPFLYYLPQFAQTLVH